MASPELSKAARNEKRKLTATYFNNMAIALFVAGVAAPYYAMLAIPAHEYLRLLPSATDSYDRAGTPWPGRVRASSSQACAFWIQRKRSKPVALAASLSAAVA